MFGAYSVPCATYIPCCGVYLCDCRCVRAQKEAANTAAKAKESPLATVKKLLKQLLEQNSKKDNSTDSKKLDANETKVENETSESDSESASGSGEAATTSAPVDEDLRDDSDTGTQERFKETGGGGSLLGENSGKALRKRR